MKLIERENERLKQESEREEALKKYREGEEEDYGEEYEEEYEEEEYTEDEENGTGEEDTLLFKSFILALDQLQILFALRHSAKLLMYLLLVFA